MTSHDFMLLFLQLALMLAVALAFGGIARRLQMPAVLGEILGGILLGPTFFGHFFPEAFETLFTSSSPLQFGREAIIKLGMILFLFVTGAEINLGLLREKKGLTFWMSSLGILFPFALGFGAVLFWPGLWPITASSSVFDFGLFLGTALSISALPVIARILMDLKLLKTDMGTLTLSTAAINDVVGWSLFSFILSRTEPSGHSFQNPLLAVGFIFGFFLIAMVFEYYSLKNSKSSEETDVTQSPVRIGPTMILILAAACLSFVTGTHGIFGAFAAGILLSKSLRFHHARQTIMDFAVNFFAPIYFVSIGLKVNFALHFDLLLTIIIFVIACFGKIGGVTLGGLLGKMPFKKALAMGYALNARGAMEIILAASAFEHRLITEPIFVALVIMALLTSLMSGPLIARTLKSSP